MYLMHSFIERDYLTGVLRVQVREAFGIKMATGLKIKPSTYICRYNTHVVKRIQKFNFMIHHFRYICLSTIVLPFCWYILNTYVGLYCAVEVDEYGRLDRKARTNPVMLEHNKLVFDEASTLINKVILVKLCIVVDNT